MSYTSTKNSRRLTVKSLFRLASEPPQKVFYKYVDGEDLIQVQNDTFNIVSSRDVRKNVRISAEMAISIAQEHPEKDVFYVNSYAGVALLKEAFEQKLQQASLPVPLPSADEVLVERPVEEPVKPLTPEEQADRALRMSKPWMFAKPGEMWVSSSDKKYYSRVDPKIYNGKIPSFLDVIYVPLDTEAEASETLENSSPSSGEAGEVNELLPNLHIHDVPFGTWSTWSLASDIRDRWHAARPVVVINSFEFCVFDRGRKERMVTELIDLQEKMGLTVIVFSHAMKADLSAGFPGRGPLGILAAKAGTVVKLTDPFEQMIHTRTGERSSKKGVIHETQMHSAKPGRSRKEKVGAEPAENFPEYKCDPWLGHTRRAGALLSALARNPILADYYWEHKNDVFVRGEEPTGKALMDGIYFKPDYGEMNEDD